MRDATGYDAWYNETVRCLTSDDGNRIAIKHSGGWFLALALPGSRRGSVVGNPYSLRGLHDKVEIADASAIAYVQDGVMPPEYADLPRDAEALISKLYRPSEPT